MESKNELTILINSFKEYRDMITPIESCLKDFSETYKNLSEDIAELNNSIGGNIQEKLDKIYKDLSSQADKSKSLSSQIDRFVSATNHYVSQVDAVINLCGTIEKKIGSIDDIQKKAELQIEKLNLIIEDKKKNYNLKQLEKNLETYNVGVQQVTEYINKDVAKVLEDNSSKITEIHKSNKDILDSLTAEKESIVSLVENYRTTNNLLKQVVENEGVNEEYIYTILDKWADSRQVKTKK